MKLLQWQPRPNRKTQTFWIKEVRLVPNGHTIAGFAIGAIRLATMATLQLRALHKTKSMFLHSDFNFLSTYAQENHLVRLAVQSEKMGTFG